MCESFTKLVACTGGSKELILLFVALVALVALVAHVTGVYGSRCE